MPVPMQVGPMTNEQEKRSTDTHLWTQQFGLVARRQEGGPAPLRCDRCLGVQMHDYVKEYLKDNACWYKCRACDTLRKWGTRS